MRSFPVYVIKSLLFISGSCTKEKSFEKREQTPPAVTDGLLVKLVAKATGATDSAVTTFTYNTSGKLVNMFSTTIGLPDQQYLETEARYYRNNDGMIIRYVVAEKVRYNNLIQDNDSIVYNLHFNGALYTYVIRSVPHEPNKPILDSMVYTYDNKGRFGSVVALRKDEDNNNQLFEFQHTKYIYDGENNVVMMSITFKDNISTRDPAQIISFTYDDKPSPFNFGVDGLLDGFVTHGFGSTNNLVLLDNPDIPDKISYTYEFNALSKPVKAVETDLLTGGKKHINYYY